MATLSAAMVTLLTDNWAGAGAAPTFGALIDYQKDLADTTEQVIVRLPIHEDATPINDIYSNFKFTVQLRVKTTVSEARLKILTDETIRILNSYAITGITRQFAKRGENTSDRRRKIYSYDVWARLEEHVSTGGTAYASPGAGDVPFPRDVSIARDLDVARNVNIVGTTTLQGNSTVKDAWFKFDNQGAGTDPYFSCNAVNQYLLLTGGLKMSAATLAGGPSCDFIRDEDDMSTDSATSLATQQSIKAYIDNITSTNLAALLMFGSANAAYVPCSFMGAAVFADIMVTYGVARNVGANDMKLAFLLPKPCNKGSLKLYISNAKYAVSDADVDDYINTVLIYGDNGISQTTLDTDHTNHTTTGDKTFSGAVMPAAAIDCSSYQSVYIYITCVNTDTQQLDLGNVRMECYYAA